MRMDILQGVDGAGRAEGLAVVIDVLRATSFQCWALSRGAERIVAVGDLEKAYALKAAHPDWLLAGERGLKKPDGFDFGNSPSEIERLDLGGRTMVHTTSHGTQGMAVLPAGTEMITAAFVNAAAVVEYLKSRRPERISFVCMGNRPGCEAEEDTACARYLIDRLEGRAPDFGEIRRELGQSANGAKFLSARFDYAPPRDFELCFDLDRFDFTLEGRREEAGMVLARMPSL